MVLFGVEMTTDSPEVSVSAFFRELAPEADASADAEARQYAQTLVAGVVTARDELDELLRTASTNWRLERMARTDRNVLRIATWELRAGEPRAIVIDEAVELAKRFGTEESGAFVNGVLTKVADELGK